MGEVEISNTKLRTVRDAIRELNRMVDALEKRPIREARANEAHQMRAVVISIEDFSALQRQAQSGFGTGA